MKPVYHPVECGFYDVLISYATHRIPIEVQYDELLHPSGSKTHKCLVEDVYTLNKEEFLMFSDGFILRLDQITEVSENNLDSPF